MQLYVPWFIERREKSQHEIKENRRKPWIEVGNLGHPAGTDTVGSVDQNHGQDGDVPLRLNAQVIVLLVGQQRVVRRVEDVP